MINLLYSVVAILSATGTLVDPPEIEWTREYFDGFWSYFTDVIETTDHEYVATGLRGPADGPTDACMFGLSSSGELLWTLELDWYYQKLYAVKETGDGGFIATGNCRVVEGDSHSLTIVKTDSTGELLWTKTYNYEISSEEGFSIELLPDGGYAIAGRTGMDGWILRTDANGDTLWTQIFDRDYGMAGRRVVHVDNGLTAYFWGSPNDGGNVRLIRFSMDGDILWEADDFPDNFASFSIGGDMCYSPADGGYTLVTHYWPKVAHTDSLGNLEWTSGVPDISQPYGWSINRTMEGGYIYGGQNTPDPDEPWTEYFGVISRYYPCGTLMWWDHIYEGDCMCIYSIRQLSEGGYIAAGQTLDNKGLLIKYAPETGIEEGSGFPGETILGSVYPNPSTGTFRVPVGLPEAMDVRIEVYDITGRLVALLSEGLLSAGEHSFSWDAAGLPSGCYLVRLSGTGVCETRRCVLVR